MKIIAFYLPQFHPTKDNDTWWGDGFTEWTNVAKAKPLFHNHYQPKIPSTLGFYDLRLPEVRERQAQLASEAGISAFCYYHYWFGDGKQELELPFNEVVKLGTPDFPFCLCWANESWSRKFWDKGGAVNNDKSTYLIEQKYLGQDDNISHFNSLLKAFKDKRYMQIDNKLVFVIYKPFDFIEVGSFMKQWNDLAIKNGFAGFYFIAYSLDVEKEYGPLTSIGFQAVCSCRLNREMKKNFKWFLRKGISILFHTPRRCSYKSIFHKFIGEEESRYCNVFPTIIPNWDHTPRSGINGDLYTNCTPALFKRHVKDVFLHIQNKPENMQICFLKSWNEWGEGNYMEPDLKYGRGFINALRDCLSKQ